MTAPCWAIVDIGSNTVMTLAVQGRGAGLAELAEWQTTTRLGQGVDATGRLDPAARRRTLEAIVDHLRHCRERCPRCVGLAVATSAARDARDGAEFLESCCEALGARPRLLSGDEEAAFTFRGIVSDLPPGRAVVHLDVGGSSSEATAGGTTAGCRSAESVRLGCVRIGERFELMDRPAPAAVGAARVAIRAALEPACRRLDPAPDPRSPLVVLSGGSATTYAAVSLGLERYEARRVHGWTGQTVDLAAAIARLCALTAAERGALPGLSPDRAPVLPAGLLILHEFLDLVGATAFRVSTRGLRFGLARALSAGDVEPTWVW